MPTDRWSNGTLLCNLGVLVDDMSESSINDEHISYWTEWWDLDSDGTLHIKVTGLDGDSVWTGVVDISPSSDDYAFWRWVVSDRKRRRGIKRRAEIDLLRANFAKAGK